MAYCTQNDLETALTLTLLVQLTDDEATGAVNATRVAAAIAAADAEIDGALQGRYRVPLSPVPPFVKKLSIDLAHFRLYARRAGTFEMPPFVRDLWKAALEALKAIREGELDLGIDPPPAASSGASAAKAEGPERVFTDETLEDY
jgi:phage gp36-like protein